MQIFSSSFDMNFCHYVKLPNIQALFPSGKPFTVLPNRMSSPKQALNVEWMPPRVMDLRATQHQTECHALVHPEVGGPQMDCSFSWPLAEVLAAQLPLVSAHFSILFP